MRPRSAAAHGLAALAAAGAAALRMWPPETSRFYPVCPVYRYLHLLCPGCGGTRAVAALLHLDLGAALRDNALIVVLLPYLTGLAAVAYWRAVRRGTFSWPGPPRFVTWTLIAVAAGFGIARNVPALHL